MTILYSPLAHLNDRSSGFYLLDDQNAPSDAFPVSDADHALAINLLQGSTYSFTAPVASAITGTLHITAPSNSYLLEQAQGAQLAAMDAAYNAANTAPIAYLGTSFQADQASQDLIAGVMTASGGSLPSGFMWYDASNTGVEMTYTELQGLAGAILSRGQPLFSHKQTKKAAIRAATTVAQVEAITW